uniref:Uncharacterized protein n=1 Tax=Meloidogyne javanica TaxID=6303 RepID=A0A915MZ80_MELJA
MSSPTSSHYPNPQQTFPKPKYSLNLRPEDCSNNSTMPPLPSPSLQKQQQNSPISPSTARCRAAAQIVQRQQGSTDSAPTSAGISSMKRKEIWARVGPSSFHQSFDIRSDPITNFSTSCGHINDAVGGVCCACKGYRTERRSGFCSGDSSRDSRSHPGNAAMTLYCGVSGCSGHPSCPGVSSIHQNHHHHLNNNLRTGRSTHSSFDEGDHSSHLSNAGGGPLRDTYLTEVEISREWMLMNGAIAPFKNILQQASSIASTPLPNHRPFQSIATPAVAASAVNTASAIMAAGSRIAGAAPFGNNLQKTNEDNEVIGSGGGRLNNFVGPAALKSSCFNLAMSEQNNNNFACNTNIDTPLTAKSDNLDQQKQIIIIEPDKKLEGINKDIQPLYKTKTRDKET